MPPRVLDEGRDALAKPCGFVVEDNGTYSASAYECFSADETAERLGWSLAELSEAESFHEIASHGAKATGLRYTPAAIEATRRWLASITPEIRAAYRESVRAARHTTRARAMATTRARKAAASAELANEAEQP